MQSKHQWITLCLLMVSASVTVAATPTQSMKDPASQRALRAMERSSTWGHPDEYGEFAGMQHYEAGDYKDAMKYFLIGARYADKLSQLSIGLMYLNGQGVQKDPVKAFAWIAIAAERKYPRFIATRDSLWSQLDADQREQAKTEIGDLYATYGDKVAKPRMVHAMRRALSAATGTGLGYDKSGGVFTSSTNDPPPPCGAATIDGAPIAGCGDLYADWRWNPKKYFAVRDGAWKGVVTVGQAQQGALDAHGKPPAGKP